MSKAAELAKWGEVSTNGQVSGRRNIVINGAMNVAQRGTTGTLNNGGSDFHSADRFYSSEEGAFTGAFTVSNDTDSPAGFSNSTKWDCTTADTSIAAGEYLSIQQKFEGQDLQNIGKGIAGAKEITVSFYVKANAAFTFGVELVDADNGRQITKLFNTTTGWVRHELTFPADVDDGSSPFDDDNASSLNLSFWLHAGTTYTGGTLNTAAWADTTNANRAAGIDSFYSSTDNNFFITGVQMEVGSAATPFEHRSFGEELALCQRYYTVVADGVYSDGFAPLSMGAIYNAATAYGNVSLPCDMRTFPTLEIVSGTNYYNLYRNSGVDSVDDFILNKVGLNKIEFYNNSDVSGTAGHAVFIRTANSAAKFALTAEL